MPKLVNCAFYLTLSLFTLSSFAQEIREIPFKGKPRLVVEESFEGKVEDGRYMKVAKDRQISWMNDNKMEFDSKGNLVKRTYYDDMRRFIHAEEYVFNQQGLAKKKHLSFIYSYKYDAKGNCIEEHVAPITDSLANKIKHRFAYDAFNRLTDIWELDFRGGTVYHQTNEYDVNGFLTRENYDYNDGTEYKIYVHDLNQNLIKMEWYDASMGLLERTSYSYTNGYRSSELWESFENKKVESSIKSEFDPVGNTISVLEINPKRQIHDHEVNNYTYDEMGNWTQKRTTVNDARFYIVERKIAYY